VLEHSLVDRRNRRVCWNTIWWIGEIGEYDGTQSGGQEKQEIVLEHSLVGRRKRRVCWNTVWCVGEIGECVGTQSGG